MGISSRVPKHANTLPMLNGRATFRLCTFAALLFNLGLATAQDADKWSVQAIGIVLVPEESNPVPPPPQPDPDVVDPLQLAPGDPDSITGCNGLLMDFLADTEYLGPLLDFVTCATGGVQTFLGDAAAGLSGLQAELSSYAQELRAYAQSNPELVPSLRTRSVYVCNIETEGQAIGATRMRAIGQTKCASAATPMKADPNVDVSGQVRLLDFMTGQQLTASATRVAGGVVRVQSDSNNFKPLRLLKTKYQSSVELPVTQCVSANCQVAWVFLRNKNVNTGAAIPCRTNNAQVLGSALSCEVDSRPFNQRTAN